jgi:hypothetical protein
MGCGDGLCTGTENCASCKQDCGVCSVCPNGKCEDFESCAICPQDCGQCNTKSCLEVITCAFGCVDLNMFPPGVSLTCAANCIAQGCADTQFFADQVVTCIVQNILMCGPDFNCLQQACDAQIAACIGSKCN